MTESLNPTGRPLQGFVCRGQCDSVPYSYWKTICKALCIGDNVTESLIPTRRPLQGFVYRGQCNRVPYSLWKTIARLCV